MCLIINNSVRKSKIKYIYKIFIRKKGKIYSYYQYTKYKTGENCAKQSCTVKNDDFDGGYFHGGGLHFFISINELKRIYVFPDLDLDVVVIRLPLNKKDVIHYGSRNDVVLKKVFIPSKLYKRVVGGKKSNAVLSNNMKMYW